MALTTKHAFVSAKSDGGDATLVQPQAHWNANHTLLAAVDNVIGTDSGSTTVKELACTAAGRALIDDADATAQKGTLSVCEIPIAGGFEFYSDTLPTAFGGVVFAWANGQAVSRATYAAAFTAMGTKYGVGDGSTTFNLPDKREIIGVGKSTMGGVAARNLLVDWQGTGATQLGTLGSLPGEAKHTLSIAELPAHDHDGAAHVHNIKYGFTGAVAGANFNAVSALGSGASNASTDDTVADTSMTGSGSSHNVVQPSLVCNYVIRIA
jgi:microcystin-dependent protein